MSPFALFLNSISHEEEWMLTFRIYFNFCNGHLIHCLRKEASTIFDTHLTLSNLLKVGVCLHFGRTHWQQLDISVSSSTDWNNLLLVQFSIFLSLIILIPQECREDERGHSISEHFQ